MRTAVTRALGGLVVVATLACGLSACTGDEGSSTPTPQPSSEPTTSPTERVSRGQALRTRAESLTWDRNVGELMRLLAD